MSGTATSNSHTASASRPTPTAPSSVGPASSRATVASADSGPFGLGSHMNDGEHRQYPDREMDEPFAMLFLVGPTTPGGKGGARSRPPWHLPIMAELPDSQHSARATRTGYVALVGRPNAGKSTLLNTLVGEKLSIVTPKAQTTWQRVTGIHTTADTQMIFLDTPGLLEAADLLQAAMLEAAYGALREADLVLLVVDATRPLEELDERSTLDALALADAPRIVAVNKVDLVPEEVVRVRVEWAVTRLRAQAFSISALRGTGIEPLRDALATALPEAPFLYPADEIASAPVRFFVAELVRETIFERYRQEIPYSVICRVEEFREDQDPLYVAVTAFVERASQKRILIGKGGSGIRDVGRAARAKIEHFLGRSVYLDLWVKTLEGWRRNRGELTRLGFHVPESP